MTAKKLLFLLLGTIALALGVLGVFIPGLPTTPFLLLTAYFYSLSSERLYNKLINHKLLGSYIKEFKEGISVKTKIRSISLMWVMIFISSFVFIKSWPIRILLFAIGLIGTFVMSRLPGRKTK